MSEDHDWIMMAGSRGTGFFLKSDGTLWTVGSGSKGVSGVGDGKKNRVLTQIGTDTDWAYIASPSTAAGEPFSGSDTIP